MNSGVPTACITSGLVAIQAAVAPATTSVPAVVPIHHHRSRYSTAGKTRVKNPPTSRHADACAPVTADRARATSADSLPTSAGSCPEDRTTDRWVDTRW